MQTHSTTHVLTLSDLGLEGEGRSPRRRSPKADMARAHVLAYTVAVVVVFLVYMCLPGDWAAKKRGARGKRISIRVSEDSVAVAKRVIEVGTIFWLEDLCSLFHAMKQAAVRFIYICLYCIYVNIRLRKPRQRWRHQSAQLVSLLVPFPLNSSGNQSSRLEMASLQRRGHASEEENKL